MGVISVDGPAYMKTRAAFDALGIIYICGIQKELYPGKLV